MYYHVHLFWPGVKPVCVCALNICSYIQFKVLKVGLGDEIYTHMNSEGHGAKKEILIGNIQQGSVINIPGGRPANISSQHQSESDDP